MPSSREHARAEPGRANETEQRAARIAPQRCSGRGGAAGAPEGCCGEGAGARDERKYWEGIRAVPEGCE